MFSKIILDPRYDFSMNETSLEPEHISNTNEPPLNEVDVCVRIVRWGFGGF